MTKVYLQAMKWAERIIDREILTILRSVDRPLNYGVVGRPCRCVRQSWDGAGAAMQRLLWPAPPDGGGE